MKPVAFTRPRQKPGIQDFTSRNDKVLLTSNSQPGETAGGNPHPFRGGGVIPPILPVDEKIGRKSINIDSLDISQNEILAGSVMDQVKALCEKLGKKEQKQVLDYLSLQSLQKTDKDLRDVDMWINSLYQVCQNMKNVMQIGFSPAMLKQQAGSGQAWQPVSEFMEDSGLMTLKVVERQSVYRMLAGLVVENAQKVSRNADLALSAKLLANCASNVASLFDNEFPGYLQSGLALMVAKRLVAEPANQ